MSNKPNPDRVKKGGSRWYDFGGDRAYPSVTTVTGTHPAKKKAIEGFEDAVGKDKAEYIKNYTALRGTLVHHRILNPIAQRPLPLPEVDLELIEDSTMEEIQICEAMWDDLDYDVGERPYVEERTWSHEHGYAGTADLLTEGGTVTDLKTSKPKPKGWAPSESQKMQVSAYFHAIREMDHLPDPKDAAIIVLHPDPEYNPHLSAKVERLSPLEIDEWFDGFLDLLHKNFDV